MKQLVLIFAKSSHPLNHLQNLHVAVENIKADKFVFYDGFIPVKEIWENATYQKFIQLGVDKTEKVMNAFIKGFLKKYESIIMIEANAPIETETIEEAFIQLKLNELVIGPVDNGSLYLLGMKRFRPEIFESDLSFHTIRDLAEGRKITFSSLTQLASWVTTKVTV